MYRSQGEGHRWFSVSTVLSTKLQPGAGVMPRRANRVGIEVESQKGEEEPHADSSTIEEDVSSSSMKSSRSTSSLEAAKAQRQKELLRKKKAERRAHAKQRMVEKQQRSDEKKQTRELLQMLEEDVPAVEPPKVLISNLTLTSFESVDTEDAGTASRQDTISIEGSKSHEMAISATESLFETTQEIAIITRETAGQTEIVPKKLTGSTPTKSAYAAASTIQKALKKNYKKCKQMFRQTPRVFAEEIVSPPVQDEVLPQTTYEDGIEQMPVTDVSSTDAAIHDNNSPLKMTIETTDSPEREERHKSIVPPLFKVFFVLLLMLFFWMLVFFVLLLLFLLKCNFFHLRSRFKTSTIIQVKTHQPNRTIRSRSSKDEPPSYWSVFAESFPQECWSAVFAIVITLE
ncbi:hypothetical protein P3T76_005530 [Phytophthora citrophthora]|uniref:Uncharacterized protein n=1 Tax=Phytophthora citrophthora TaxID=4793 RepID=A0AAD9LMP6_9STRA|nr:hypothetical protein P3T76_005530 [Phytophthora citrophthora]